MAHYCLLPRGTSRCLRAGGERIPWKGRARRSPRGAERSRASSQRSEEHIQNLSLVICSPRLSRGEASRRSFLFWCRLFLERREGWGSVFLGEKFLFKLRSREIERRALLASRELGFGLLCSSEITEFYFIFFYSLPVFSRITEDKEIIILLIIALNLKL